QGGHGVPSMRRDGPGAGALTAAAAALWTLGVGVAAVQGEGPADPDAVAPRILPVSAHTGEALREPVAGLVAALMAAPRPDIDDLCHTAALGRDHLAHRVAVVADTLDGLRERLAGALASGAGAQGPVDRPPRVALVFPGQGGAWAGMGRELLAHEPAFRRAL